MSNADSAFSKLELDLIEALAWELPTSTYATLDQRVGEITARGRRAFRLGRRPPMALIAAGVLVMGAAATLSLVQQAAQTMPGHVVAYDRGTPVNLVQRSGGFEVTLERAYLDPNQLVLAFSAVGNTGRDAQVPRADVVDGEGRHYLEFAGADAADSGTLASGSIMAFDVPPGVKGLVELTVTVEVLIPVSKAPAVSLAEPLVYHLVIRAQPATAVNVDQTATVGARTVTLRSIRVSPTAVRVRLDTDLAGLVTAEHPRWALEASLRPPSGDVEALTWMALPPDWTGQPKSEIGPVVDALDGSVVVLQTTWGRDSPSGTWTVIVDRLVGFDGKGGRVTVEGPWVLEAAIP